jgi:hypothetical protein
VSDPQTLTTPKEEIDAKGKWVVLDVTPDGPSLLAVGGTNFPGISARNWLDKTTRMTLLGKLRDALNGADFEGTVPYSGAEYKVVARAIWSPDRTQIVGAYGIFDVPGALLPEKPSIGTWQWRVDKKTGKNVGEDSSRWDDALFELYGIDPSTVSSDRGPAGEWLAKLISTKDRNEIKLMIDSGIAVNNRQRHQLSYEIIYQYGSPNPGKKQVSMSARAYDDPDFPEAVMLRGFSREVASPTKLLTPGLTPVATGLIPGALFALVEDRAFAAIDLVQEITFQTSSTWSQIGLQPSFEGNIAALAHPDDKFAMEGHLKGAAQGRVDPAQSLPVRLRAVSDTWLELDLTVARIDVAEDESRYLMTSLKPTKGAN